MISFFFNFLRRSIFINKRIHVMLS